MSQRRQQPRVQLLLLHHMFPDEDVAFRRLLQHVQTEYRIIGYSEAVDRIVHGRVDDAYLTLSFDDGFKCCRRAAEIMNEFDVKGCFFLCPPMIGERDVETVGRFCRTRLGLPPVEFMDWDDIYWLREQGHEIGAHTMGHVDLGEVSPAQAHDEIQRSFDVLVKRLDMVAHFAWPYGRFTHIQESAIQAVYNSGFVSCASAERGSHAASEAPMPANFCLRRDTIEANWPLSHIQYFLHRSGRRPLTPAEAIFPIG